MSVLTRQRLAERMDSKDWLKKETLDWQYRWNDKRAKVDWRFTASDARIKLKTLSFN